MFLILFSSQQLAWYLPPLCKVSLITQRFHKPNPSLKPIPNPIPNSDINPKSCDTLNES